jgi:hypothetical protein
MKLTVIISVDIAFSIFMALTAVATTNVQTVEGSQKVTICHNGNEITVKESAVAKHIEHGDSIGPCQITED